MKRKNSLPLVCLLAFSLSSCDLLTIGGGGSGIARTYDTLAYKTKDVNVYRDNQGVDKTIKIRFYDDTPSIPYINVTGYFKEFFKTQTTKTVKGSIYRYNHPEGDFLAFDPEADTIYICYGDSFQGHPDMDQNTSKFFLKVDKQTSSAPTIKAISLASYGIDLHYENKEIYAPLTLLSCFAGGICLLQAAYNGESIYFCDGYGSLTGELRGPEYFKDTYFSVLGDYSTKRPQDMIDYAYGQLCMMFDNDRGYTTQLLFGDNNLNSMGLDGLLEVYYPKIKEHLLSDDKETYYRGYHELLMGLWDGGHTSPDIQTPLDNPYVDGDYNSFYLNVVYGACDDPDLSALGNEYVRRVRSAWDIGSYEDALKAAFGEEVKQNGKYYHFDETHSTSYIGFDSFVTAYTEWDDFYAGKTEETPNDTYGHVLRSLNQALEDGATNVVFDITCNGGGDTGAMAAVVGLFNKGHAYQNMVNVLSKCYVRSDYLLDVNLDGEYDEEDVTEAEKFEVFNVGVLTSLNCFSCGNTFPSMMQQKGFKTMGGKTSGGSCAICYEFTADGLPYIRSSHYMIGLNPDGSNIDDGVTPDFDIAVEVAKAQGVDTLTRQEAAPYFYDLELISNYLENAYAVEEPQD